jgi:predicted DNA-binding ribbon-helix-helix protein
MTIAGHQTSISLEPLFWDHLKTASEARGLPINALVARIDVERLESDTPCGLASAIRLWLVSNVQKSTVTKTE